VSEGAKKEIHVLHVLNSAHGGSAISTFELIQALSDLGIKSSLVCFNNAGSEQVQRISKLVEGRALFIPLYWMNKRIRSATWKRPLIEAKSVWDTWYGHRYQSQISQLIQQHGINVIHTSTILNPEGAIAAWKHKLPHVWHVRELVGPDKHFQFYGYKNWAAYVQRNCRYLIANSVVTEQCLHEFFPKERIKYIPNGINSDEFVPRQHTNQKKPLVVGMVGSVTTRWKNHAFFIRVAAAFQNQDVAVFRIYGVLPGQGDPYYEELKSLVKELSSNDSVVQFVQFKSPPDIMKEIDVLFHPCEFESFGRIFTEAMAANIPLVAVSEGGALEVVREGVNGFLVKKNVVEDAQRALNILLSSEATRNEMGKRGREIVSNEYSLNRLANAMKNLYQEVIES
jgi:glycosyltransferase involved in cell wall biosynthesis